MNEQLTVGKLKKLLSQFSDDCEVTIGGEFYPEYGGNYWMCVTDITAPKNGKRDYYIIDEEWD